MGTSEQVARALRAGSVNRAEALLAAAERRLVPLPERGVEIALLDWGGDGPLALLHHANGFCKGVWALVADGLRQRFRVVAMDARGHGDSSKPEGPRAYRWHHFAEDIVAVAERLVAERGDPRVAVGIGHSFGGTSMLGACVRRPRLFERIVLVDPVTPPPPDAVKTPERNRHVETLVAGARNRRASWPSRAQARAWWSERAFFRDWVSDALDLYVLDGLRDHIDGSVELKCPGEIEATIFGSDVDFDVFDLARAATTPALFQWAKRGNFPRALYEALAACMSEARVEDLDCGHLAPMERPDLVVDGVLRFVDAAP